MAPRSRSSPAHGSSRQYFTSTSMNELPVASITLKPVLSSLPATGSAMPACMRIPQRLCWPSRSVSSSSSTCGIAQLSLQDLARGVPRQLVDHVVLLGALVAGDVVETAPVECGWIRASDDVGDDALAPVVVRHADDGNFRDRLIAEKDVLHLARVDVVAAGDDHVLRAVHQREVAVLVEAAEVAGVEPAVAQGLGRRLGHVEVAGHDGRTVDQHLADLARPGGHAHARVEP